MHINKITLLGHKDHGKSTLIGNMLIATGTASEQRIKDAKITSKKLGRRFEPGYILDSFEEERQGEMTIDTTRAQIKYKDTAFEFIDVPGHEELIKNMISGASYASFALLVVSAKADEGIRPQTKRHIFLAKMMGINKIIVAVNKMDTIKYSEKTFKDIKAEIEAFLDKIGIERKNIHFIPISAYNSENLLRKSKNLTWYRGAPLLESMRELARSNTKNKNKETLRIILQGSIPHQKGKMIIGNVISGSIRKGDNVRIMPIGINVSVSDIFVKGAKKQIANAGENVAVSFNKPMSNELRGCVLYSSSSAQRSTNSVDAVIFLTRKLGKAVTIKFNGNEVGGEVDIKNIIDTTTGAIESKKSGNKPLNAAEVRIKLERSIPAEPSYRSKELGRFTVYDKGIFSGIGIIN
jgi:elongation factor 1-alpha